MKKRPKSRSFVFQRARTLLLDASIAYASTAAYFFVMEAVSGHICPGKLYLPWWMSAVFVSLLFAIQPLALIAHPHENYAVFFPADCLFIGTAVVLWMLHGSAILPRFHRIAAALLPLSIAIILGLNSLNISTACYY